MEKAEDNNLDLIRLTSLFGLADRPHVLMIYLSEI